MITGIASVRQNNFDMINQMNKLLEEEESVDTAMRAKYQQKWARMPSASLNQQFKAQLGDYQSKAQMGMSADKQIEEKFAANSDKLKVLNKTKAELSSMIP